MTHSEARDMTHAQKWQWGFKSPFERLDALMPTNETKKKRRCVCSFESATHSPAGNIGEKENKDFFECLEADSFPRSPHIQKKW